MNKKALIIANQRHDDQRFSELPAATADAEALGAVLRDPEIGGFQVAAVVDQTERTWRTEIFEFFDKAGPDDLLLLHLSCHGRKDRNNVLHFVARDTELDRIEATAVDAQYIAARMERSRSRRIVVLLDCCYSGAFIKGVRSRGEQDVDVRGVFGGTGRVVITSSTSLQYSFEPTSESLSRNPQSPSYFTATVVEGLTTGRADLDLDGHISVDDLFGYLADRLPAVTAGQNPTLSVVTLESGLLLARNPNAAAMAAERAAAEPGNLVAEAHAQALDEARAEMEKQKEIWATQLASAERAAKSGKNSLAVVLEFFRLFVYRASVMSAVALVLWVSSTTTEDLGLPSRPGQTVLALAVCALVYPALAFWTVMVVHTLVSFAYVAGFAVWDEAVDDWNSTAKRTGYWLALIAIAAAALVLAVVSFYWIIPAGLHVTAWISGLTGAPLTVRWGWGGGMAAFLATLAWLLVYHNLIPNRVPDVEDTVEMEPGRRMATRRVKNARFAFFNLSRMTGREAVIGRTQFRPEDGI
ncbi:MULTISPECIES: caspase family protein [unclassified Streptomyces]|uniref:caspase family protein n=1 Tax=unclassified Streptomyces TaxID=2593676 RepID=UPI002E287F33|nr:caspase family protein [Streptomyces sp. NBC_00223]